MIEAGAPAPDFTLPDQDGEPVSLAGLRGRAVVLAFYPLDFSPVCTDQLSLYQEELHALEERGAALYGVSVDSAYAHREFRARLGLEFSLLSDFHPKGEVSRAYGLYVESHGVSARGFVVVDARGRIAHWHRSPSPLEVPGADLILAALDR